MPKALINGVNLYYEVHGEGFPLVWSHEFAGDYRSWAPQVRFFSRRYRVVTYNARGYPSSDVPADGDAYSQEQAVEDLRGLLEHLGVTKAHIGGLSMGGNVALNFGLDHPELARSLIVAGTGTGSTDTDTFREQVNGRADRMDAQGMGGQRKAFASLVWHYLLVYVNLKWLEQDASENGIGRVCLGWGHLG